MLDDSIHFDFEDGEVEFDYKFLETKERSKKLG